MKRLICIILMMMIFTLSAFADHEVEDLSELGLICGDQTGYNLNGELTRAEAATFIVKLLGEEAHVKEKAVLYANSNFSDVNGDEWYAPYVGYCERNHILSGYPDGTVRAEETLSEQAFLVMILKSMGKSDISWESVYDTSIDLGLIESKHNNHHGNQNKHMNRGQVVSLLHKTLNMKRHDDLTYLEHLVQKNLVTREKLNDLDLLPEDDMITSIKSLVANKSNQIVIKLNEEILSLEPSQIEITTDSGALEVKRVITVGNTVTITTGVQNENTSYTVKIKDISDLSNHLITLEGSFIGYYETALESDFFIISKVTSMSKDYLKVEFTQPITSNTGLYMSLYKDNKPLRTDISVSFYEGNDKTILAYLEDVDLIEGEMYTLKIKDDLKSDYGTSLNQGSDQQVNFIGSNREFPYQVELVKLMANDYIRVVFNRNANDYYLITEGYSNYKYELVDMKTGEKLVSSKCLLTGTNDLKRRQVDVHFPDMIEGREYELIFPIKKDAIGGSKIVDGRYSVYREATVFSDLSIQSTWSQNEQKIVVSFDRALSKKSEEALVSGISVKEIVFDEKSPNELTLYLDRPVTVDTSITINGVYDTYDISHTVRYSVAANFLKRPELEVADAKWIGNHEIKVEFSDAISSQNSFKNMFLEYTTSDDKTELLYVSDYLIIDTKTVILEFRNSHVIESCKLNIMSLKDITGLYTTHDIEAEISY
ncbi:MAG: S-layer homology domain-containing protein [Clostridiales bacterium]|nr:S-layer homology domain-containing protein [Clostridiales bacterium]